MFTDISEEQIKQIENCIENSAPQCEFTVGVLFMWAKKEGYSIDIQNEVLTVKLNKNGKAFYYVPQGSGDRNAAVERLLEKENGQVCFTCVNNTDKEWLKSCGYELVEEQSRDEYDYVYSADDLVYLRGKKYHGKRNHIHSFYAKYPNCSFELTDEVTPDIYEFLDEYYKECENLVDVERDMVYSFMDIFKKLNMKMGVLRVDGKTVALSVGEMKGRTLYVHIEKALRSYEGAAEVINNEYAKVYQNDAVLINREDDNGSEGLRFAKTSYHPISMIEKSNITLFPRK